jgi:predicted Zn finger-like uncharacterized protein
MYTQCPECDVAFRVTAEILRQAAGKVRCGGCGIAFNALEHLSEEKPQAPVRTEPEPQLPELTPEPPPELEADIPPQSISAEQSAALLKTLDQLAGSDIRIEDTGVEWRVLDVDPEAEPKPEPEEPPAADEMTDTGSLKFFIEDEIAVPDVVEEMRFDDNTPLPDDFDSDEALASAAESEPVVVEETPVVDDLEEAQVDLAFGEPDEWEDLLGDLDETEHAEEAEQVPDIEDESKEEPPEEADDLVVLGEPEAGDSVNQPLDMDTQFAIQAEAMGIDLSGLHSSVEEEEIDDAEEEPDVDDGEPETSIDDDLIAAAFETEAAQETAEDIDEELEDDFDEETGEEPDEELEEELEDDLDEETGEEPDEELEEELEDDLDEETGEEPDEELDEELEDDLDEEPEKEFEQEIEGETEQDLEDEFVDEIGEISDDDVVDELEEELELRTIHADEQLEEALEEPDDQIEATEDSEAGDSNEHIIPEMTEEEMTINMMIDQELLSVAVEDEDGFASTIVQKQPDKKVKGEIESKKTTKKSAPLFETIVMEGESVRGDLDRDKLAKDRTAQDKNKALQQKLSMKGPDKDEYQASSRPSIGMIFAALALLLLLAFQFMHQSREALATMPAFNSAVGPAYRALGKPLTPAWDISGWRVEQTTGNLDDAENLLTIYSRIGNRSEKALPYPLVHLSLTDRFEDIVGSRVLEPSEYLAGNADPRKPVAPENTFFAVMSIDTPSDEATGFKLNVCYRLASGDLRCAIEDFR